MPDVATASLQQLADSYRRAATAHGRATVAGDYKTANRHHEILASVYRELRARGASAQSILLPLMQDDDEAVRVWAATHALEFVPDHAAPVLEEISKRDGTLGFGAKLILREWKAGKLSLP